MAALRRRGFALVLDDGVPMFQAEGRPPMAAKVLAIGQISVPIGHAGIALDTSTPRAGGAKPPALLLWLLAPGFTSDPKDPCASAHPQPRGSKSLEL